MTDHEVKDKDLTPEAQRQRFDPTGNAFDHQMVVIVHQAISVAEPVKPAGDLGEDLKK